jgi:hypothetical protein
LERSRPIQVFRVWAAARAVPEPPQLLPMPASAGIGDDSPCNHDYSENTATTASTGTQATPTSTTTTAATSSQTQLGEHSCPDRGPEPSPCPFAQGNVYSDPAYCATSVVSQSGCRVEADGNTANVARNFCDCTWGVRCRCGTGPVSDYVIVVSTKAACGGWSSNADRFRDCIMKDSSFCTAGPGRAILDNNILDSSVGQCCTAAGGDLSNLDGRNQCLV